MTTGTTASEEALLREDPKDFGVGRGHKESSEFVRVDPAEFRHCGVAGVKVAGRFAEGYSAEDEMQPHRPFLVGGSQLAQIRDRLDGQACLLQGLPNSSLTRRLPGEDLSARKLPIPGENATPCSPAHQPAAVFLDQR